MKFGDKLSKLRKEKGLSQEGLAEKLEVTRQTVSKWELSQTKPDTDMLVKLADVLGVEVSSLIVDEEKKKKKGSSKGYDIDETKPRTWLLVLLIILALAIAVVLINKVVVDRKAKPKDNSWGIFNIFKGFTSDMNKKEFNWNYETKNGTQWGININKMLDDVITNNKTNDRKITVVYNETSSDDPSVIKGLKSNFDEWTDYEVSLDYDDDGYVNKITIEDLNNGTPAQKAESMLDDMTKDKEDVSVDAFNGPLKIYEGSRIGSFVKSALNSIADSNQKNSNHLITVNYGGNSTTDPETIRNLRSNFDEWTNYEVTYSYDNAGYINQATIK